MAWAARKPSWRREDLARALALDEPIVRDAAADLSAGRVAAAQARLARHVLTRPRRWPIVPRDREPLACAIRARFPSAAADARHGADRIAAGRFDLLGYHGLPFDGGDGIDWHRDPVHGKTAPRLFWSQVPYLSDACGDHKIIWELNRHQHWLALGRAAWLAGEPRDRDTCLRHLASWMAANPPLVGVNWASMLELGLRSISWIWALHFFTEPNETDDGSRRTAVDRRSPAWSRSATAADRAEPVDLVQPEHPPDRRGTRALRGGTGPAGAAASPASGPTRDAASCSIEITRQIGADGGHAERSFHYHRYTLDFYLLALAVARATGDDTGAFADAVERLARFARIVADDTGRLARIGDDDGGRLFPICGRDVADASDSLALAARLLDAPSLAVGPTPEEVCVDDRAMERAIQRRARPPPDRRARRRSTTRATWSAARCAATISCSTPGRTASSTAATRTPTRSPSR